MFGQMQMVIVTKTVFRILIVGFTWNIEEDFRAVPESWIPAKEIELRNGKPFPDENGHIPGRKYSFSVISPF